LRPPLLSPRTQEGVEVTVATAVGDKRKDEGKGSEAMKLLTYVGDFEDAYAYSVSTLRFCIVHDCRVMLQSFSQQVILL